MKPEFFSFNCFKSKFPILKSDRFNQFLVNLKFLSFLSNPINLFLSIFLQSGSTIQARPIVAKICSGLYSNYTSFFSDIPKDKPNWAEAENFNLRFCSKYNNFHRSWNKARKRTWIDIICEIDSVNSRFRAKTFGIEGKNKR